MARRKRIPPLVTPMSSFLSDPSSLIDREREIDLIRQELLGDAVRLLTITGPGGIGKTRLARAAAASLHMHFPDGAWFVDLEVLQAAGDIDVAIAHTLRLTGPAKRTPRARVDAHLKTRRLLLLLDNFEYVLPAAGRVAELLGACPGLKVLVTSRVPLNLRSEHRLPLEGLALPDRARATVSSVAHTPAGVLFLERSRSVQPAFALTPSDAPALANLLHMLDGIPLAIEIVAARSNALSPTAMLARTRGEALLAMEEVRDAPARHHTLNAAIEWSYRLLDRGEQAAFRQLGTFAGGWTLNVAEDIVRQGESSDPVWKILGSLVDKSLVQAEAVMRPDRRYRMLGPIRDYALERLAESGESEVVRERHAAYYLALAEQVAPAVFPAFEDVAWRQVDVDYENFVAALRWGVERGHGDLVLRLAGALADFWGVRGYVREGRRLLAAARALGASAPPLVRARALTGEGLLAFFQGDYAEAQPLYQEALSLVESVDPVLTARILSILGDLATFQGNADDAQAWLERSLVLSREAGDRLGTARALIHLGHAFAIQKNLERAAAAFCEGLDLARAADEPRTMAFALTNLALLRLRRRDYPGAAEFAAEALRLARPHGYRRIIKHNAAIAALISEHLGDLDVAARLLADVQQWSDAGQTVSPTFDVSAPCAVLQTRARDQLGKAAYLAAVEEAQMMSVDQVADMAQACLEARPAPDSGEGVLSAVESHHSLLSDRERAVVRLISEGLPNKQIATALNIAERTVKAHVTSAMNKLGVDNRAHAAVEAIRHGLV